ncbi:HNH endonuclease signature motif containing protein [Mycobacterium kyogaense]|uniref:HNH endonuclease signature motif containing protein n=1 Tax=Mycobacterium kyogaense TaxID=2212479 RepID=UPI000DAB8F86|nr:HNH endonuclease signature motif containing protein [Mycobacterium kyogaense]
MYVRTMVEVQQAVAGLRAAVDAVLACRLDRSTAAEVVELLDELENAGCRLPAAWHRALARLQVETSAVQMGAKNWKDVLAIRYRISGSEANRRLTEAALLAPRQSMTGAPLPPTLPATAEAQAEGRITPEHVDVIRKEVDKLPSFVDAATREQFEADVVRIATGAGPKATRDAAELERFLLDQDGPEPDDAERVRKRSLTKSRQGQDAMTQWRANLTPEAAAVWEAIFAKYAAPGMCNPDDPEPCISGTPTQEQIDNDHRSLAQRQHDALVAVGRIALMSGELGQLNGLPVTVIVRTTLQDLESRAGIGTTGGGTRLPIKDVIRMGSHASHYLAVFDRATGSALDLFRTRRVASAAQRIMLIAREGGCTKPGCPVGAYGCQVHHVTADWAEGGLTNIDDLGLACPPDNRAVAPGGWSTAMNARHDVEWTPPPNLDTGQTRINTHHTPERLLRPEDESESGAVAPTDPVGETEGQSPSTGDPSEPGGPAPPDNQVA